MKKIIFVLSFFATLLCQAQFYFDPYQYQQNNQAAYEYGRRLAEEFMQQAKQDPNKCLASIIENIAFGNLDKAEDWADALADINQRDGYFYLGIVNELMEAPSHAKNYYTKSINAGGKGAQAWLDRLNREGAMTSTQRENVQAYFINLYYNATVASSAMLGNIWQDSTSSPSTGNSSSYCRKCNGTGYEPQRYFNATGNYYYNSPGAVCPICGYSDKHYHYKCYH